MYAVGRLGSYFTRVSAPFHPFGGAVDIVVVEQQDGSFRSSPWYVCFGKFQGVLKAKENVVDISVNGEGTHFHMYLDHTGQAYFLREVDAEEGDIILSPTSSGEETNGQDRRPVKANSWNYGDDPSDSVTQLEVSNGKVMARTGSRRSRLLGLAFGRKSMKQNNFQENGADVVRTDSLERAEIATDLLELNWSTNLSSIRKEKDNASCLSDSSVSKVGNGALKRQSTIYFETLDSSGIELDDFGEQAGEMMLPSSIKSGEFSVQAETSPNPEFITEASSEVETQHFHGSLGDGSVLTETSSEPTSVQHIDDSAKEVESCSALTSTSLSDSISQVQDQRSIEEEDEMKKRQPSGEPFCDSQEVSSDVVRSETLNCSSSVGLEEEQLLFSDLDDFKLGEVKSTELISLDHMDKENYSSLASEDIKSDNESFHSDFAPDSSPHKFVLQGKLPNNGEELIEEVQVISSQINIPRSSKVAGQELGGTVRSLPIIRSHFDEMDEHFLNRPLGHSLDSNLNSSKWVLLRENVSGFIKSDAESLFPLTKRRAKPAVPIGGAYRLIDVPMSNCINSGINKVYILTQFNSASLNRHIARAYNFGSGTTFGDGYVEVLAATQTPGETGKMWFQGTADAVRQFHWLFEDARSKNIEDVLILSGDHLYRMDYMDFVQNHRQSGADITISCLPMDGSRASDFGLMNIDSKGRVLYFSEKPKGADLKAMAVDTTVLGLSREEAGKKPYIASMGVYVFKKEILLNLLRWRFPTANDFGSEIIPASAREFFIKAYLFNDYWEDIGTIRSFFEANLALTAHPPKFSFYDASKPMFTSRRNLPPSKIDNSKIVDSIVSHGSFLTDSFIEHSVVGIRSRINSNVHLKDTVMLGADYYETEDEVASLVAEGRVPIGIGENTKIKECIIDKNARIGKNVVIANSEGVQEADRSSEGFYIRSGITVILKNSTISDGLVI